MTPAELTAYLRRAIPLTTAMGVAASQASSAGVSLTMPLEPNTNHRGTMFGGSMTSLALLAGFAAMLMRTREDALDCRIVVQRSSFEFTAPALEQAVATAAVPDEEWQDFLDMFRRRGRAHLTATVEVTSGDTLVGRLDGVFVALPAAPGDPSGSTIAP